VLETAQVELKSGRVYAPASRWPTRALSTASESARTAASSASAARMSSSACHDGPSNAYLTVLYFKSNDQNRYSKPPI